MDLVAALGVALDNAPLGPAGSLAKAAVVPTAVVVRPAVEARGDTNVLLGALLGVSIGTAAAAGVGYGLGRWFYPEFGGMPFAKVGAVGYLVPVGIYMGLASVGAIGGKRAA